VDPSGDLSFKIMRITAKLMLVLGGVKVYIDGIENVDMANAQVFASNHVSAFDIIVLTAISPVKTGWVAKQELFYIPFLGWLMRANGHVAIDRSSGRKALLSIKKAAEKVKAGNNIVIFPEGTRSRDEKLLPFKKGVFHLCTRTGVPIVPIFILGTYDVLRPDSLAIRSGNVYVKFGKCIPTTNYPTSKAGELMDDLRTTIIELEKETITFKESFKAANLDL
jgi:1-acyl-sn-glycerol-3-phosphate acyltransferase